MTQRPGNGALLSEEAGEFFLWLVWGAALLLFGGALLLGIVHLPLPEGSGGYHGIELAIVPLAALAGSGGRLQHGLTTLRRGSLAPLLPWLAAALLAANGCLLFGLGFLGEAEAAPSLGGYSLVARALVAALFAASTFLAATLYPRRTAVWAGATAIPSLLVLVVLAFPELHHSLDDSRANRDIGYRVSEWLALGCVPLAVVVAVIFRWRDRWPPVLGFFLCSALLMLPLTVFGYLLGFTIGD